MARFAIIQEKKPLKQRLDFLVEEKIRSMDSIAIIQDQKIVEKRLDFAFQKTLKLWLDWL